MLVYFSHRISNGSHKTSAEEQRKYCEEAVQVAEDIKERLTGDIEIYVPGADSEKFVSRAIDSGFMTIEQVLDVDCQIIDSCDAVICRVESIGDQLQGGRKIEVDHAEKTNKPCLVFDQPEEAVAWLVRQIMRGDY